MGYEISRCPHCFGKGRCNCADCGKIITEEYLGYDSHRGGGVHKLKREKSIEGICKICKGLGGIGSDGKPRKPVKL